jgi:hypothetical protein
LKTLLFIVFLSIIQLSKAQDKYILIIDSIPNVFNNDVSFPYWMNSNQTVRPGPTIKSISIIEFKIDTAANNNLIFQKVISLKGWGKVPNGNVWKIESIGVSPDLFAGPIIFKSPQTYSSPGTYNWIVPPGVTYITVEVWGAGGNGSGAFGYGGGGGGYGMTSFPVLPKDTFTIIVGNSSESSWFSNKIYATSGGGGTTVGGIGGTSNGVFKINGGIGGYCSNGGGNGGNGGGGGKTIGSNCSGNVNGIAPGGGGSGVTTYGNSGFGAPGQVIIHW